MAKKYCALKKKWKNKERMNEVELWVIINVKFKKIKGTKKERRKNVEDNTKINL